MVTLNQIQKATSQFWYPDIMLKLHDIKEDSTIAYVIVDLDKIYKHKDFSLLNRISILFSKMIHHIKECFSADYRDETERSFRILNTSIDIAMRKRSARLSQRGALKLTP
jgi:hypothetical protein